MTIKILPASDVRSHFSSVLKSLHKDHVPCFVTKSGRAIAALLSMELYEQLMSDLEDRLDETDEELAQEVAEARRDYRAGRSKALRPSRR